MKITNNPPPATNSQPSAAARLITALLVAFAFLLIVSPLVLAQNGAKKSSKSTTQPKKKPVSKAKPEKQDKYSLEAKKKKLQADIDLTDKLLKQTRRSKTLSLSQLLALNQKIEARQAMIAEINSEIYGLDEMIRKNSAIATQLDSEVVQLKRNYARMIVYAYRNRDSYQRMMFIFSAKNFNQAFMRMRYMKQIGESRKFQYEKIAAHQAELNENIRTLEQQKNDKRSLLGAEEKEQNQLASEKSEKDRAFRELQSKESQLKNDLDKKKSEQASISNAIRDLIAAEAARLAAAAAKAASKSTATGTTPPGNEKPSKTTGTDKPPITATPKPAVLGANFSSNIGTLPWPVAEGTIASHFGKRQHPVLETVYTNNNGIDIATTAGAQAKAVFEGQVTGVTNIPGSGWLVIIRHGDYLTVYAKLESIHVKTGDNLKTGDTIGKVSTDGDDGTTQLHFEVWKSGPEKLDPEQWLMKKS